MTAAPNRIRGGPGGTANRANDATPQVSGVEGGAVVPFHRRCKVCSLAPDAPGYPEVLAAIREAVRNGDPLLPLHRELEEGYLRFWPPSSRFSYDALHNHATKHMGMDALPARPEVRAEVRKWAADLEVAREEHADGVAMLRELAEVAIEQMSAGLTVLTGADVIRIFGLLRRIEQEEEAKEREEDLVAELWKALDVLADVIGRLATDRFRGEVRQEVRRLEARGRRGATLARTACLRWNGYPPAEHELADELGVVG